MMVRPAAAAGGVIDMIHEEVRVGPLGLPGTLERPPQPLGVVVFAHGSGSSRHSPRNRHVADVLHAHHLATLLLDLLSIDEADDRRCVFDIALLAERVTGALDWLAASRPGQVAAVVSRGGRPDLAGPFLAAVQAPTLLIVGGADTEVLQLNRDAMRQLRCNKRLEIVPGATHLFEEPGALDAVAHLAGSWFSGHLPAPRTH